MGLIALEFVVALLVLAVIVGLIIGVRFGARKVDNEHPVQPSDPTAPRSD